MKKTDALIVGVAAMCMAIPVFFHHSSKTGSQLADCPPDGFVGGMMQSNGESGFVGVMLGNKYVPLTNWHSAVAESNPSLHVHFLRAKPSVTARAGQIWCAAHAICENVPKITYWPARKDAMFPRPEFWITNYWPLVSGHAELLRVIRIEEPYAYCQVTEWSDDTTAVLNGRCWLLDEYLTNNAVLVGN